MKNKLEIILNKLNEINYGYVDKNKNIYIDNMDNFSNTYYLQSPEELIKTKYGVCWDQVELERYYLNKEHINSKSYFIIAYDNKQEPTHTFIVVNDKDKYYWIEHAWQAYEGIHEYNSLNELLLDVKNKFQLNLEEQNINKYEIEIFEYVKPKNYINCNEFMNYCKNGKKINI